MHCGRGSAFVQPFQFYQKRHQKGQSFLIFGMELSRSSTHVLFCLSIHTTNCKHVRRSRIFFLFFMYSLTSIGRDLQLTLGWSILEPKKNKSETSAKVVQYKGNIKKGDCWILTLLHISNICWQVESPFFVNCLELSTDL